MRVALVHDWLFGMRGGEKCLEALCELFPDAEIFTLFATPEHISPVIARHRIITSPLNRLPGVQHFYRYLLPLFPYAIRRLGKALRRAHEVAPYDLVLSVSHCAAKNIPIPNGVPHLCYCLTPVRYLWDQYDRYFSGHLFERVIRVFATPLRRWDVRGSETVTEFCAISEFVRDRIQRYYHRTAQVIFPPVTSSWITPRAVGEFGEGFLVVNALVPYKNTDRVIEAFNVLGLPLTIVGSGPEEGRLRRQARDNIQFLGWVSESELAALFRRSKALIFAAEEDFGITPVEMQSAGRPVIALGRGGARETVRDGETGLFFSEPTAAAICDAVKRFLEREGEFTLDPSRYQSYLSQAENFSRERFFQNVMLSLAEHGFETSRPTLVAQG